MKKLIFLFIVLSLIFTANCKKSDSLVNTIPDTIFDYKWSYTYDTIPEIFKQDTFHDIKPTRTSFRFYSCFHCDYSISNFIVSFGTEPVSDGIYNIMSDSSRVPLKSDEITFWMRQYDQATVYYPSQSRYVTSFKNDSTPEKAYVSFINNKIQITIPKCTAYYNLGGGGEKKIPFTAFVGEW